MSRVDAVPQHAHPSQDAPCGCPAPPRPKGLGRLAGVLSVREGAYLLALAALYASAVAHAVASGGSLISVVAGRGFPDAHAASGAGEMVAAIWLSAGKMLTELMPFWLFGMLLAGGLVVLASFERMAGWFRSGGVRASGLAAGAGSAIPICSCGMAPLLGGMTRAGVPLGPAMAFVIAAPMINIPAVLLTAGVLGPGLAVGRVVGSLSIAMLAALLFGRWARARGGASHLLRLDAIGGSGECSSNGSPLGDLAGPAHRPKWLRMLRASGKLLLRMNGYLLLAVLLAGTVRALVPPDWIVASVGGEGPASVALAAAAASVLYLCTYTEVPTAAALMDLGMGQGATLAYLLVGPGISLPSLALLSAVFRPRLLVAYAAFAFVCAVSAGLLFGLLIG